MRYFYNCKTFGLRGNTEHKNLDASQFIVFCSDENSYTLFNSWNSKTFNGGLEHQRFVPRSIKQCDTGDEKRVLKIFKLHLSMIPANGPFYRKPLSSSFGFGKQSVGINTLSTYTKKRCLKSVVLTVVTGEL